MRLRVPYTVWLVIAGLAIGLVPHPHAIEMSPGIVLFVFLPPLLFAGGWGMDTTELRSNWAPVTLFATFGVALSIAISAAALAYLARVPMQTALIFGAIVAATDPVAVLALFRALRANRTIQTIVEAESLFNDGTSVVAFTALLAASSGTGAVGWRGAAWDLVLVTAGGVAVGAVIGYAVRLLIRFIANHPLFVALLTIGAAYGAYFAAGSLGVSGIMAVIFAAIVIGGSRSLARLAPEGRAAIGTFWSVLAFAANSIVFLLIGLSIHVGDFVAEWPYVLLGVASVLISRPVMVRALAPFSALLGCPLTSRWQNAIAAAGMRGALSMALVLSLPEDFPSRSLLVSMVFAVVLFTVVVQGVLLEPLLRAMGLIEQADARPDRA
jgi:monovalent cation:H+ antiporter, CPA1 family